MHENLERYYIHNGGIFLLGRGLGGAVAVDAINTSEYEYMIDGLILENTFTSIKDMVHHNFYFMKYFTPVFLNIGWNTN